MKLTYYADIPNFYDHEQIVDLLYTISEKYVVRDHSGGLPTPYLSSAVTLGSKDLNQQTGASVAFCWLITVSSITYARMLLSRSTESPVCRFE